VVAGGVLLALIGGASVWRRCDAFYTQVQNFTRLERFSRDINRVRETTGKYPLEFDGLDVWNRPVVYRTDGENFALISFGADGVADRPDYTLSTLLLLRLRTERICPGLNGDTILVNGYLVQGLRHPLI
jgi:hypothetical protein